MPVGMRMRRASSTACSGTGPAVWPVGADCRADSTRIGRSSKLFHASHCGHLPSQRGDSKPQPEQKYTERVFATT
jgi:hypothetical protein